MISTLIKSFKEYSSLRQQFIDSKLSIHSGEDKWFIDNKLSVHSGEDKTKSILFSKAKELREINISFAGHSIKQHETVEYLGYQLVSKLRGEPMASKILKKINAKLKFLHHQSKFLILTYRRLSHMLIMDVPHTDPSHCSKINWLPVSDRVECCIANTVFKY